MSRARVRLDWDAWVGIVPQGLVNEITVNLGVRPGRRPMTPDDLRGMAAQALQVSLDEIRWFYRDEDLVIGASGSATIRHRKDALYHLEQGDFERPRFMSCMGAMHWDHVDFLPVVELFKSLLPGTGSAVFELIRGLYDDQQRERAGPLPLRYRGIPPYPSEGAFRLFSSFYVPRGSGTSDPLSTFMDPGRSSQLLWHPAPDPPLRYFDRERRLCLTFRVGTLQKLTCSDDSTGLPYVQSRDGYAHCDRSVSIVNGKIAARDREHLETISVTLPDGVRELPVQRNMISPMDWRALFVRGVPPIAPEDAFGAVLLYPAHEDEIGETAAQPFVADYIQDLAEQDRDVGRIFAAANRVLIVNGDAVIGACVAFDRPREYTVRVSVPAMAQRQAQQLWGVCAKLQRWDWLSRIRFVPLTDVQQDPSIPKNYDLMYYWIPYAADIHSSALRRMVDDLRSALSAGGHAFITGPRGLESRLASSGVILSWSEPVDQLPTFRMHKNILPKARLKAGLTLYHVVRQ